MTPETKEWLESLTEYLEALAAAILEPDAPYNLQPDVRRARDKFRRNMENL